METRNTVILEQCEEVPALIQSVKDFVYNSTETNDDGNDKFLVLANATDDLHNSQLTMLHTNVDSTDSPESLGDLCRVCANATNHMIPIFEDEGAQHNLANKIHKHLPIIVSEIDTLPLQLCYHCAATLLAWHDLLEGCSDAEQKLLQMQAEAHAKHPLEKDVMTLHGPDETEETVKVGQIAELDINEVQSVPVESLETAVKEDEAQETQDMANTERSGFPDFQKAYTAFLSSTQNKTLRIIKNTLNYRASTPEKNKIKSNKVEDIPSVDENAAEKPSRESLDDRTTRKAGKNSLKSQETQSEKQEDKQPFICTLCGKSFRLQEIYNTHMRVHTGEKMFTCHVCGKQFGQTGSLYYHLRHVHGGVKNHSCDLCGRSFAMKSAMEDHRRIHTGERPYVCDSCGKTFKTKASLYIHGKTHSDQYPFKCTHCKKAFRMRQPLLGHMTIHTGEKNHICDVCGKSFGVKYDLTRHKRIHSQDKPYVCEQCGVSFAQKRYLRSHERIRHK